MSNEKGEPIAGATVQLRRYGAGPDVKTDKKGRWAYLGLAGGPWDVDVVAEGFQPRKVSVRLSEIDRLPPMQMNLEAVPQAAAAPAPVPKDTSAEILAAIQRGNDLLAQKDYAGARAEYEKALAALPDNAVILRGIAQTWYGEKKIDEAIATLKRVVLLDPADTTAPLLLANLLLEKGNLDEAKELLAKLPPDSIKDPGVYVNFGVLLLNQKKPADAWSYFDQAVRVAPRCGKHSTGADGRSRRRSRRRRRNSEYGARPGGASGRREGAIESLKEDGGPTGRTPGGDRSTLGRTIAVRRESSGEDERAKGVHALEKLLPPGFSRRVPSPWDPIPTSAMRSRVRGEKGDIQDEPGRVVLPKVRSRDRRR